MIGGIVNPYVFAAAPAGPPSFINAASAVKSGGNVTVSVPSGTLDNDVMVAIVVSAAIDLDTPPSGWTLREQQTGTQPTFAVWTRVASSEPASYTWSGANADVGAILTFRGVSTANPFDIDGAAGPTTSTAATAPSITTSNANAMVIAMQCVNDAAAPTTPPSGMTERVDESAGGGNNFSMSVATVLQAAAGASGAKAFGAYGFSATWRAYTMALRSA